MCSFSTMRCTESTMPPQKAPAGNRSGEQFRFSALCLGHIENVFDKRKHDVAGGRNFYRVLLLSDRVVRFRRQVSKSEDAVERRAQVVTQVGQEAVDGAVRFLRHVPAPASSCSLDRSARKTLVTSMQLRKLIRRVRSIGRQRTRLNVLLENAAVHRPLPLSAQTASSYAGKSSGVAQLARII